MADYRTVVVQITQAMSTPGVGLRVVADGTEVDSVAETSPEYLATVAADPYWGNVGTRVSAQDRSPEIPLVTGGVA